MGVVRACVGKSIYRLPIVGKGGDSNAVTDLFCMRWFEGGDGWDEHMSLKSRGRQVVDRANQAPRKWTLAIPPW